MQPANIAQRSVVVALYTRHRGYQQGSNSISKKLPIEKTWNISFVQVRAFIPVHYTSTDLSLNKIFQLNFVQFKTLFFSKIKFVKFRSLVLSKPVRTGPILFFSWTSSIPAVLRNCGSGPVTLDTGWQKLNLKLTAKLFPVKSFSNKHFPVQNIRPWKPSERSEVCCRKIS